MGISWMETGVIGDGDGAEVSTQRILGPQD
jgi:hypothetical protein